MDALEMPITMNAGNVTVGDGAVTLPVTIMNSGAVFEDLDGNVIVKEGGLPDAFGRVKGSGMIEALDGGSVGDLNVVKNLRGGTLAFATKILNWKKERSPCRPGGKHSRFGGIRSCLKASTK